MGQINAPRKRHKLPDAKNQMGARKPFANRLGLQAVSRQFEGALAILFHAICRRFFRHYGSRPFGSHFTAWIVIALGFGLLMVRDFTFITVFACCLSGCIVCAFLSVLTYPFSDKPQFIVAGALFGALMAPMYNWIGPGSATGFALQLCVMIGALMGATAMIWMTPLKLLGRCRR